MARELLETIVPAHWESQKPGSDSGAQRTRWLQGLNDLIRRPVANRQSLTAPGATVICNGAVQSTGMGIPNPVQPKRYSEFTVKARITANVNSVGPVYHYVYRTLGTIPANGAAPHVGDVAVGGDPFAGGPTTAGINLAASFSFLDAGLDQTKQYRYYLAVQGPNGNSVNVLNTSQLLVMERS